MSAPATTQYVVRFERIGRHREPADLHVELPDDLPDKARADALAQRVHTHAAHFLGSPYYQVRVDLEEQTGLIEGGRFGRFTITEVQA